MSNVQKSRSQKLREILEKSTLHQAAQELGSRGGKIGGPRRAAKLSAAEKKRIATMGGRARWRRRPTENT